MFEYHVERGASREYQENNEWACLVDAVYTFNNDHKTTVNCIFSRVYLDDMDLINMANCDEAVEEKPVTAITVQNDNTVDPSLYRCRVALRKKLEKLRYSLTPDEEVSMLEQNFGPLVDVHFKSYKSSHKSNIKKIKYPKRPLPDDDEASKERGRDGDVWESVPDAVSSSSSIESVGVSSRVASPLSEEELRNFDFAFCPTRDAALVAKNADKHFAKDKVMHKYWYQRNRFFSKLTDGILMDREGWFSVTPERVARHVADRVVLLPDCTVLDAFAGVGGNAIQFALRGAYVIAVDLDPVKLRCARQNARVYGVEKRICFICASYFHVATSMFGARAAKKKEGGTTVAEISYPHGIDAVFLSPPWGGPAYLKKDRPFDLLTDMEPNGVDIFRVAQQISPNIVFFLPRNTRTDQLIALAGPGGCVEIEQAVLSEKIKALHAYYGLLVAT